MSRGDFAKKWIADTRDELKDLWPDEFAVVADPKLDQALDTLEDVIDFAEGMEKLSLKTPTTFGETVRWRGLLNMLDDRLWRST